MNQNKVSILFLLQKVRLNKQGKCPIRCRITFQKKRKEFSTGFFVNPDYWKSKQQIAKPPNKENNFINTQLSLILQNVNQAFLLLQIQKETFDVDDVYLQYKGENVKADKTLLEVFELHNDRMNKLIGIEYSKATYNKFLEARKHTFEFIKHQYKRRDFYLKDLTLKFLQDFDYYLKLEKNHKQITINKSIQRVRKIAKLALAEGYITLDPFILYRPKKYEVKIVYLTTEELRLMEEHSFAQKRLEQVKDMFVFCCYTGLAYQEMSSLRAKHISKGFDGNLWINMNRKKTNQPIAIPLLPQAEAILDKYKKVDSDKVLPTISNQKFNSYLKEIASIVGIEKKLTHHIARKTFATTVLLYNGVSMEVVSELLGHSKITVTQEHYAKVVKRKVSDEIFNLKNNLK